MNNVTAWGRGNWGQCTDLRQKNLNKREGMRSKKFLFCDIIYGLSLTIFPEGNLYLSPKHCVIYGPKPHCKHFLNMIVVNNVTPGLSNPPLYK